MHLVQDTDSPTAETVLFHLTLFVEFCETHQADLHSASIALECLRDATEALCSSVDTAALQPEEYAAIATGFHQAEATFREEMPDFFIRTGAERGFAALKGLAVPVVSDGYRDREVRSIAVANAERFGKTLGAFVVSLAFDSAPRGPERARSRGRNRALDAYA